MSFFKGIMFFLIAAASFKMVDVLLPVNKSKTRLTKVVLYILTLVVGIVGLSFFYYGAQYFVSWRTN